VRIVVAGALANKPGYGGEAWVRLAWVRGLLALGVEVLFVEILDPGAAGLGELDRERLRATPHVRFFESVSRHWGVEGRAALLTPDLRSLAGLAPDVVRGFAEGADLLVNISGHLRPSPLFHAVRRRAYVDLDPGFTQFWHAAGEPGLGIEAHAVHFTVGENVGTPLCSVPTSGVRWLPLRQPVVLADWPEVEPPNRLRFTTLASWRGAYGAVEFEGRRFGLKAHEFRRFSRLAEDVGVRVEVALDIHPDDGRDLRMLRRRGWHIVDPSEVAATPSAFRSYVQGSGAELSVAQGIYVDTHSGWFSDRSARYLATGRPVVVQDTGFGRRLPTGDGLLAFATRAEAVAASAEIVRRYDHHRRAARQIAEEFFDARDILRGFLERALDPRSSSATLVTPHVNGAGSAGSLPGPRWVAPPGRNHARPTRGRRVLVSGMVGGVPGQGGASWAVLQYVLGLLRLGWDVHLVEEVTPSALRPDGATLAQSANARYFRQVARRFGIESRATLLLEKSHESVGLPYADVQRLASRSDILLNLSGGLSDELAARVPVRAYLDLDPAFTQLWQEVQNLDMGLDAHTHFVTVGLGLGTRDCPVPTCGRQWIRTLPPVVLEQWPRTLASPERNAWTTIANWRGYGSIEWQGRHFGQKAHAFRELFELPSLSADHFELALAIHDDEKRDLAALSHHGWSLLDPGVVAGDPDGYRRFIRESVAELGVAKTGYLESRSGWFSDRSACYLASGRPVLAQDTGFSDHVPTGLGLIPFQTLDEAVEGVGRIRRDHGRHARAAREFAETYLDSDRVLARLMTELDP
jgi:hypothetical protein